MNPFRHPQITDEMLSAYIDGAVTVQERKLIESAVESNAEVAWRLDTLRQTVNLLRSMPDVVLPRSFLLTEADVVSIRHPVVSPVTGAGRRVARPRYVEPEPSGFWQPLKEFLQDGNPLLRNLATASLAVWVVLFAATQLDLSRLVVQERPTLLQTEVVSVSVQTTGEPDVEPVLAAANSQVSVPTLTATIVEPVAEIVASAPASVAQNVQVHSPAVEVAAPVAKTQELVLAAPQVASEQIPSASPAGEAGAGIGGGENSDDPATSTMRIAPAEGGASGGGEDRSGGLDAALSGTDGNAPAFDAPAVVSAPASAAEKSVGESSIPTDATSVDANTETATLAAAQLETGTVVDTVTTESSTAADTTSADTTLADTTSADTTSTDTSAASSTTEGTVSQKTADDDARSVLTLTESVQVSSTVQIESAQLTAAAADVSTNTLDVTEEPVSTAAESANSEVAGVAQSVAEPAAQVEQPTATAVSALTATSPPSTVEPATAEPATAEPATAEPATVAAPTAQAPTATPIQVASSNLPAQPAPAEAVVPLAVSVSRTIALLDPMRLQIAQAAIAVLTAVLAGVWLFTHRAR